LLPFPLITPPLFAQASFNCKPVSGAISTNFIDQKTTLGTATGDLRGGLGVNVLGIAPGQGGSTVFHNHHNWVTETGDTLFLADAFATAYPAISGLNAVICDNGVQITGGTGHFAGATGALNMYGAVDLNQGRLYCVTLERSATGRYCTELTGHVLHTRLSNLGFVRHEVLT
jgi:hypothetical protein